MGINRSKLKAPQFIKQSPYTSTNDFQQPSIDDEICRLAVDHQSAGIGSLYDARYDQLLDSSLRIPFSTVNIQETKTDPIIKFGTLLGEDLLNMINIDTELCVSIYLKLIHSYGIPSIINYPFTIDKYTRFFSYYYLSKTNRFLGKKNITERQSIPKFVVDTTATHIITEIKYGIHVIIVMQPSKTDESNVDYILQNLKNRLTKNTSKIKQNEEHLFNQFTHIKVFSNISDLCKLTKLSDIYQKIVQIKAKNRPYYPLKYTLRSINWFYSSYPIHKSAYVSLNKTYMDEIITYLRQLSFIKRNLEIPLDSETKQLFIKYFKDQYEQTQQDISQVEESYQNTIEKYRNLTLNIRRNFEHNILNDLVISEQDKIFLQEINNIFERLNTLKVKVQLIEHLTKLGIDYWNVKEFVKNNDESMEIILQELRKKDDGKYIYCFDDKFEKPHSLTWESFFDILINTHKENPEVKFVYGDFSFCSYKLPLMKLLRPKDIDGQQKSSEEESLVETTASSSTIKYLDESNLSNDNFINILLLGESGVGKSTFINAIVNYLRFKTLDDAHSNQPIVLMPVSFLMTIGDDFQEKIVTFGEEDSNEDYHHPGQSVTQQCRSYIFTIHNQIKIRLIDTPGMGDTRGLDQDDFNMQHILSFINNFSHLNAICILLKPNESRLNVVFRSYFTQLLQFLGENIRNNIIFCFTNTRTTFYAPGNTGPLLKKMLQSHLIKNISFTKTNSFCFDNESFRYLIARLNDIEFDDYQKDECTRSWVTSVKESNRLLEYICNEMKPYPKEEWKSFEHVQFQITQMIRPILETIRNLFRNLILYKQNSSNQSIKLCPTIFSHPSTICTKCTPHFEQYNGFFIRLDDLHIFSDKCNRCPCSRRKHINVDYELKYKNSIQINEQLYTEMQSNSEQLINAVLEFGIIFVYTTQTSESNDPILSYLNQMIKEENELGSLKDGKCFNLILCDKMKKVEEIYKERRNNPVSNENLIDLTYIYELIKNISKIHSIKEQMDIVEQYDQQCMKKQEKEISLYSF